MILVLTKGCCVNLTVSPLTGALNTTVGSNFQLICGYILESVIGRGIFAVEDENKLFECALSNSAAFDDLELPRTLVSRSQYSLKVNISQTVHDPLHVWFYSPWLFSVGGSKDAMSGSIKSKMASDGHLE